MTTRSLFRLVLALLPAGVSQAQASVFRGPAGGVGDVQVFASLGAPPQKPPELQGIVLLPIDATGRSAFTQFQPDQTRLETDVPLASRLVLPQHKGSLYRYRRSGASGTEFGFFVVKASGLASFLVSFPGVGAQGANDPIPNPVAISGQGDAMLVATSLAAGGDVFEVGIESGSTHPLTAGLPPLDVMPQGLILLPTWGAALTSRGPLRFVRGDRALTVPLEQRNRAGQPGQNPPPSSAPALSHFGNGIVASADGSTVAVIAGTSAAQAFVFTFALGGPAVQVNDAPAAIADPGFGTQAGPLLALSADGRRAAWKTVNGSGECFSRRVPTIPTAPEFQITSDAQFADTLNDTGVIAFFDPDSVVVIVGEPNGIGGIEKGDLFRARFPLGGGVPLMTNLSNTSGDTVAPFTTKGELETSDGIFQIPGQNGSVYFVDGPSGQGEVYRLNGTTGVPTLVRSGVSALDFIERAGSNFVLGILHDQPSQRELLRIPFDQSQPATSIGLLPGSVTFASHAGNLAGTFAGAINVVGGQRAFQVFLPTGTSAVWPDLMQSSPLVGFDGSGAVLSSVQGPTRSYFVSWALGGSGQLYGSGPLQSLVLPAD
jgi:hypothetical protein